MRGISKTSLLSTASEQASTTPLLSSDGERPSSDRSPPAGPAERSTEVEADAARFGALVGTGVGERRVVTTLAKKVFPRDGTAQASP